MDADLIRFVNQARRFPFMINAYLVCPANRQLASYLLSDLGLHIL